MLFLLLFSSASGAWFSWLVIGPIFSSVMSTIVSFGALALVRQLLTMAGTWVAEHLDIEYQIIKFNFFLEYLLIAVNTLAIFSLIVFGIEGISYWIFIWASLRFFLGGVSTSLMFRLLLNDLNPSRSIVTQLAVSQGSVILGSLMAYAITGLGFDQGIKWALFGDIASSIGLTLYLHKKQESIPTISAVGIKIKFSKKSMFSPKAILWDPLRLCSMKQILGLLFALVGVSGLPSLFLGVSSKLGQSREIYTMLNGLNGLFFTVVGLWQAKVNLQSKTRWRMLLIGGLLCSFAFGVSAIATDTNLIIGGLVAMSAGAVLYLVTVHHHVLGQIPKEKSGVFRAALAIYLSIIFGFSELINSFLFENHLEVFGFYLRILALFGSLLFFALDKAKMENS